jgi:hypothetical protein
MIRAAALAVVLSLSGPSALAVACGLACEMAGNAAPRHTGCEADTTSPSNLRLTGTHTCDHLTAEAPFVVEAKGGTMSRSVLPAKTADTLSAGFASPVGWLLVQAGPAPFSPPSRASVLRI